MSKPGSRSKRHIEFALPAGMTYRAGDYLAVLARNPDLLVDRVLRRLGLAADTQAIVRRGGASASGSPANQPLSCGDILANYVELAQPATRAQVSALAASTRCPPEKAELEKLVGAYPEEVLGMRLSVIDLLERFQSCEVEFGAVWGCCRRCGRGNIRSRRHRCGSRSM